MRNLKCIGRAVAVCQNGSLPLTATTWNADEDCLICAFGPSQDSALIELRRLSRPFYASKTGDYYLDRDSEVIAAWDAPCPLPDLNSDHILSLHYLADSKSIFLVLEGGDFLVVREDPRPGEEHIEIIGSVDAGLTSAAWSPDGELLAISTRANTLLYMTRNFENVCDVSFTPEDLKVSKHVSVGWGKVETQFKGKRAHALRDPTIPERIDSGVLSDEDSKGTSISWRGDGAFVAVNTIEAETRRVVRIYSRDGVLESVSEPVDYLEGALSWRPSGNLIAGVQRTQDRVNVVFFERNGLRHGQFELQINPKDMKTWASKIELHWNVDSTVLAVCFLDRIQLWTMGNYHYYLKQEIMQNAGNVSESPVSIKWHPETPLNFAIISTDTLQWFEYIFDVSRGPTTPPWDTGSVAVIDGKSLKFTPLKLANIPPPMALHELMLTDNILDVAFNQSGSKLAILLPNSVAMYEINLNTKPVPEPILSRTVYIDTVPKVHNQQICMVNEETIYILQSRIGGQSILKILGNTDKLQTLYEVPISEAVSMIFPNQEFTEAMCLKNSSNCRNATVLAIEQCAEQDLVHPILSNGPKSQWVEVVENVGHTYVFGLSTNGVLYYHGTSLVKGVTSFLTTSSHLIFITTQHLLKFVHLSKSDSPGAGLDLDVGNESLEVPPDTPETDERCRSVERGARLVAVIPSAFALVLQMPRGNLETIYPRALVLPGIRESILAKDYEKAFLACRNHRVDMNLIYDYAPEQFISNAALFADQLKKVEYIDLFLSQLREEDVSQTLYKETLKPKDDDIQHLTSMIQTLDIDDGSKAMFSFSRSSVVKSKVNKICDALIEVFKHRLSTNLQNVITAHVCKSPPDYDSGLLLVKKLIGTANSMELAKKAIEHICFLVDVNRLYDNALGLYDLELALLVAQHSQKDPKEYLPFLQTLERQPLIRRKFSIDDYLGRHIKALAHLHALDDFEEFTSYMEKYVLYNEGLNLVRYEEENLRKVTKLYADYLFNNNKFKEAGLAYESLQMYTEASDSYRQALLWEPCLTCAALIPLSRSDMTSLAQALALSLETSKSYLAAATVQLSYLFNTSAAAGLLCKGHLFDKAYRLLVWHNRLELLPTILDSGLTEALGSVTEVLAEMKSQLSAQVPRILELRVKKAMDPLGFMEGVAEGTAGKDIPDNVSLASTSASTLGNGTLFTRYTALSRTTRATTAHGSTSTAVRKQSSKSRRREERKRARGKKGSIYEEEYLVNSVRRLVDRVEGAGGVREDAIAIMEGLVRRAMRGQAKGLEGLLEEVIFGCQKAVELVWPEAEVNVEQSHDGDEMAEDARPTGPDGVVWDSLAAMKKGEKGPIVKPFERFAAL